MFDQQIKLIASIKKIDIYGNPEVEQTEKTVFAEVKSISQNEFYQAHAQNLKAEIKFTLPDYLDYQNEEHVKYQGFGEDKEQTYKVIRSYRVRGGNELELVCKRGVE